ncbi:MAG: aminotransferase class V-fold PLP-dependent enzyme, partial [Aristaeellaceae bacterium]
MDRVFNFAAGPSTMPEEALRTAAQEMLCYGSSGMSVMEMSHRSKMYSEIFDETVALTRELMHIPDSYAVLWLQGGATGQFAAIPMNLLGEDGSADYIDSGNFAHIAMNEAKKYGRVRCVASSREENYRRIPEWQQADFDPQAKYVYITTNNTIFGTRYATLPETGNVPLVADMSSNILSEVYDVTRFGV